MVNIRLKDTIYFTKSNFYFYELLQDTSFKLPRSSSTIAHFISASHCSKLMLELNMKNSVKQKRNQNKVVNFYRKHERWEKPKGNAGLSRSHSLSKLLILTRAISLWRWATKMLFRLVTGTRTNVKLRERELISKTVSVLWVLISIHFHGRNWFAEQRPWLWPLLVKRSNTHWYSLLFQFCPSIPWTWTLIATSASYIAI